MCIVFHFLFQFVRSFAGHAVTLPPDGNNATGRDIGHLAENLAAQSMTAFGQKIRTVEKTVSCPFPA